MVSRRSTILVLAARRIGPPPQAQLHHPAENPRPPRFVLFRTRADALPDSYQRYLVNALRESFGLPGVPIRLTLREKANPYAGKGKPG
jgi:predicted GTPase